MQIIHRLSAGCLGLTAIVCDRPGLSLILIILAISCAIKGWPETMPDSPLIK